MLLNVDPSEDAAETKKRADAFISTYGPLRESRDERMEIKSDVQKIGRTSLHSAFFGPPYTPQKTVIDLAQMFSWAISLQQEQKTEAHTLLNITLGNIFNNPVTIDGTVHRTALDTDLVSGTLEPRPRDLLDAIALELLRSHRVISRCALCSKFFYREFSKDKYCSPVCASEARRRGQAKWAENKAALKEQARVQEQANRQSRKKGTKTR
jgi:hypothetical protein